MPAGTSAVFVSVPKGPTVNFATANTGRDGTGTIALVHAAGSNGAFFTRLRVQATVTTTAGVIRVWKRIAAGTWRLVKEILVTAITPSTTIEAYSAEWAPTDGIMLSPTDELGVSTHIAETFNAFAEGGGDY
jgi:hypothetical protein